MMLLGSVLASALIAQVQGGMLQGKVVDDQGKPVAKALVDFFAPAPTEGKVDPAEVQTRTDARGQFGLAYPSLGRASLNGVHVFASQPGHAIATLPSDRSPLDLVLQEPQPKMIKVETPEGRPNVGATIEPRVILIAREAETAELPESLSRALAVTTGQDGQAPIAYLGGGAKLIVARITAESIGRQDIELLKLPGRDPQGPNFTIRLKRTSHLTGRIRHPSGKPVAGKAVEVWSKGGNWLPPSQVGFKEGPLLTKADGSFRTPDNLLVGFQYRLVLRSPGCEPILSRWLTIGDETHVLMPMVLKPLRTLSGRVVDRHGKPLAGVEVFQSGDRPERTSTATDQDGRFVLGGFRHGSVFLFARSAGYRFFGRMIKPGEEQFEVVLTRRSEPAPAETRMLPEPISLEESRALARRLIEPYWEAALARKDQRLIYRAARLLAPADPVHVLEKVEAEELLQANMTATVRSIVARTRARTDPAGAQRAAEGVVFPRARGSGLLMIADALPNGDRERKLALLDRVARLVKEANSQYLAAQVADRWYELGEREKARAMFAESIPLGKDSGPARAWYAGLLTRFDPAAALAIAKEISLADPVNANLAYQSIVVHLATENPAEAERVLRMVPKVPGRPWIYPEVARKLAEADPARARNLVDEAQRNLDLPQLYLFLALGSKSRNSAAAADAFWKAIEGIDRLMKEGVEFAAMQGVRGVVLPIAEQIDPALVPEVFWRAVACRPPIANPRTLLHGIPIELAALLSFYDREVAAAIFEPVMVQLEQTDDQELAGRSFDIASWSMFDPRAAVARLEQIRPQPDSSRGDLARERVGQMLSLSYEERWRRVFFEYTDMRNILEGGIP
jgi:hypothetical protein